MWSSVTICAVLVSCVLLIEVNAKVRRKGAKHPRVDQDISLLSLLQRRDFEDSPAAIRQERKYEENPIERELADLEENVHRKRYVIAGDALGQENEEEIIFVNKRGVVDGNIEKRGQYAVPGHMSGYMNLNRAQYRTDKSDKSLKRDVEDSTILRKRLLEDILDPNFNQNDPQPDRSSMVVRGLGEKSKRNIFSDVGTGISNAFGGLFGHQGSTTPAPVGATEEEGIFEGIKDALHDAAVYLEKVIEDAVKLLDVTLMELNLDQIAEDVLGKVTNITMSPIEFLKKYGYLSSSSITDTVVDMVHGLLNFQHMYHIDLTGLLDPSTIAAMLKPRCGMPDIIHQATGVMEGVLHKIKGLLPLQKRGLIGKRNNVPGYKWPKKDITWKIHNYYNSAELPATAQRRAFYDALNFWDRNSGLSITETSGTADINIYFYQGEHGDGSQNAFDGPGGVLAHAFYPTSGEAHFDSSERFTDESYSGVNLKIAAAHEFGHAFGLAHSDVKGALMAPVYQGFTPNYQLPADDIQGIQKIYGSDDGAVRAQVTDPPTTTTTQRPVVVPAGSAPSSCTVPFRAVTQTHDLRIYAYYGRWMWRMSDYGLDQGYPVTIDSVYENYPPDNIEAAIFTRNSYNTYFFKGRDVWVYYGFYFVDKRTITTSGYPSSVQAAVTTPDGKICVVGGGYCWIFNEDTLNAEATPRRFSDVFPGAPTQFDSVLRIDGENGVFFFYGNNYYRYSESTRSVVSGYPKAKAGPFMGPACNAAPYTPK